MSKRRILFVDDEPAVLDGMRDSLRRYRKDWDMTFEQFPQKALALFAETKFDVVVSDMRMPEVDGAALLTEVRRIHPSTVRIILSGFTELEVAIRAVSVAHQFLTKPCEAAYLQTVVERACAVQNLLQGEELRALVGKTDRLPTTPQMFGEVSEAMTNPHATAKGVARIIEQDPSICAKLLQMSNSGFFRLARPIVKVEDAIVYLGYNMIKNLVLSTEVFSKTVGKKKDASQKKLQEQSRLTAHLALQLAPDKRVREDAFLAAILHDIGQVVLATAKDDYPKDIERIVQEEGLAFHEAERRNYGVSHAEVGAYLLGLWGVPFNVVEAVAYHHNDVSSFVVDDQLDAVGTVALASALAHEALCLRKESAKATENTEALAEQLGKTGDLSELRSWAAQGVKIAKAS